MKIRRVQPIPSEVDHIMCLYIYQMVYCILKENEIGNSTPNTPVMAGIKRKKGEQSDTPVSVTTENSPVSVDDYCSQMTKSPASAGTLQVKSPIYTIYRDRRVDLAIKAGCLTQDLIHDIVRGTVSNMMSSSLSEPWNRLPTTEELREMAKSLVVTYPALNDPVKGHVSYFLLMV